MSLILEYLRKKSLLARDITTLATWYTNRLSGEYARRFPAENEWKTTIAGDFLNSAQ